MVSKWISVIRKIGYHLISLAGMVFIVMAVLAFTRLPFDAHRSLGEYGSDYSFDPDVILMLGGGGMPSESNLIRLYYTAQLSSMNPECKIIIAHPLDSSVTNLMKNYLIQSGVDSLRISFMMKGTNTREQALYLQDIYPELKHLKIILITAPENMYRSIKVFQKLSYNEIGSVSAFENAMFIDLKYNHHKIGGKFYSPDISNNNGLRYNFWNYLKLEITCLREYAAIIYYKLNGWI